MFLTNSLFILHYFLYFIHSHFNYNFYHPKFNFFSQTSYLKQYLNTKKTVWFNGNKKIANSNSLHH